MPNYLFGAPALPRSPSASGQRDWLILGAYPSALHVRWDPPSGKRIKAVAIADEPEPFWAGTNVQHHIKEWADGIHWRPEWGRFSSPGELNGSSGVRLEREVLGPLHIDRDAAWITDCLDIYHESDKAAERLKDPQLQAMLDQLKIPNRDLPPHPDEEQIVRDAQLPRLRAEITLCQPKIIVTLGNAALRTIGALIEGEPPINKLTPDYTYGHVFRVQILRGPSVELIPLAHPAAPDTYRQAHTKWVDSRTADA